MAEKEIKGKIIIDTGDAKKNIDGVRDGLNDTGKAASSSVGMFGKLKDALKDTYVGFNVGAKGADGLNTGFNILTKNPITFIFAKLGEVLVGLFQYFSKMESVGDSLGKSFTILSGIISGFVNKVLTPLIDGFVWIVDVGTKGLVSVFEALGVTSKGTANELGKIADTLDDLEDKERGSAIAMAESNRKLQEAREAAADANLPIKVRIEKLKEAGVLEKKELDNSIEINRAKAQANMQSIALEIGANQQLIDKIKEGSLASLKAAREDLNKMKNVDKSKFDIINKQIIDAENAAAQSAKIAKKTAAGIESLNKEQEAKDKEIANKRKAANDAAIAEQKKFLAIKQKLLQDSHDSELTSEIAKAKQKLLNDETARLREIEAIKVSEANKQQLRLMLHETTLKAIAKLDKDVLEKLALEKLEAEKEAEKIAQKKKEDDQKKREDAQIKRLEDADQKRKEKEKQLAETATRLQTPEEKYQSELDSLDKKFKDELALIGTNQDLKEKLIKEHEEAVSNLKKAHLNDQLNETKQTGDAIISVIGAQTGAGKALGVANALINTYQGATDALRAKSTLPSPFDVVAKIANVTAVLASGFKAVKAITNVQVPNGGSGGASVPAPITPVQASTQLNAATIQAVGNAAGTAGRNFILSKDISNDREREATLQRAARLA